jgi:hypothetical protein
LTSAYFITNARYPAATQTASDKITPWITPRIILR